MMRNDDGYTLAELVVVMAVFAIVLTLTALSFSRIVSSSSHLIRSEQTQIEGMIGLELLRIDLENAGFGLPWSYGNRGVVQFSEANAGANGADAFNETGTDSDGQLAPPRALLVRSGGANPGLAGTDYLVIKGSAMGMSAISRKWTYLTYSSATAVVKPSKSDSELVMGKGDDGDHGTVIVLRDTVNNGVVTKELVMDGALFSFAFPDSAQGLQPPYLPTKPEDHLMVYGMDSTVSKPLTRPFNRTDYAVEVPDVFPPRCVKGTGRLSKKVLNQGNGSFLSYPILDCVADFQVVVGLDTNGDGEIDFPTDDLVDVDAKTIRDQVKEVRVYILAQEGGKDPSFLYPYTDKNRVIVVGNEVDFPADKPPKKEKGRVWKADDLAAAFGTDWRHYRWKLFRIVVQPKNLQ